MYHIMWKVESKGVQGWYQTGVSVRRPLCAMRRDIEKLDRKRTWSITIDLIYNRVLLWSQDKFKWKRPYTRSNNESKIQRRTTALTVRLPRALCAHLQSYSCMDKKYVRLTVQAHFGRVSVYSASNPFWHIYDHWTGSDDQVHANPFMWDSHTLTKCEVRTTKLDAVTLKKTEFVWCINLNQWSYLCAEHNRSSTESMMTPSVYT